MLLYIHIPFCDSKCSYCAFNSYVDKFHLKQEYMNALYTQIEYELEHFHVNYNSIETLFIGGGTPSTVSPELYQPIFKLLQPYFKNAIEITSEANPNSATYEWLNGMKKLGVNRISFGVQSFDKEKLRLLNRAHTPTQAIEAIKNAKNVGFENISLDIIYATLGDTRKLLQKDIEIAFSLPINHLSAYALTIEENTPFERNPTMATEKLEETNWFFNEIEKKGFKQYEISNFGTYKSTHNLGYWLYKDYIGAGCGAVGKLKNERFYPDSSVENYIKNPLDIRVETLDDADIKIEKLFLGFRSEIGVTSNILTKDEVKLADILVQENKLEKKDTIFYNRDYLLADEIVLFIMRED